MRECLRVPSVEANLARFLHVILKSREKMTKYYRSEVMRTILLDGVQQSRRPSSVLERRCCDRRLRTHWLRLYHVVPSRLLHRPDAAKN